MTTPTFPSLPLASTGCDCCAPSTPSGTASTPTADAPPNTSAVYQVSGMTCGHCASNVTKAISALSRVEDVRIDLAAGATSTVTVTGDVSPETVRQAIEASGYTIVNS